MKTKREIEIEISCVEHEIDKLLKLNTDNKQIKKMKSAVKALKWVLNEGDLYWLNNLRKLNLSISFKFKTNCVLLYSKL